MFPSPEDKKKFVVYVILAQPKSFRKLKASYARNKLKVHQIVDLAPLLIV